MKVVSFLKRTVVAAWLKNILKAVFKGPEKINVSLRDFLNAIDPSLIKVMVKIGANDGVKNDEVTKAMLKNKWKGILVEPFERSFQLLKKNFEGNHLLHLEQVGISDKDEQRDFYYLDNITPDEPDWYDQVGSFDQQTFIKNVEIISNFTSRVKSRSITCWTFDTLMAKHSLSHVDLIHIDTEGYDYRY